MVCTNGILHRVMMMKRGWSRHARVLVLRLTCTFSFSAFRRRHRHVCSLIGRVIEQVVDVVHEKRVQQLCNFFLVGKVEGTLERNPKIESAAFLETFRCAKKERRGKKRTHQTPFRCIGPIFTTCLVFSLLRIPSRRPRVIPATFSSFVPFIMWLSRARPG